VQQRKTTTKKGTRFKNKKQNNKQCENCDPMKLELSYIQTHNNGKAWPQRRRESTCTLTAMHSCHRTRIPFRHVLIELFCDVKHCKKRKGCIKEKKDHTHHNRNKKVPFQKHKIKNNKQCEKCDWMKLELSYIQKSQQRKAWPQTERERESTLTPSHICHRPRIPLRHVLVEVGCGSKHCKRGCNKEKKDQPTTNNKKGTVSKIRNQYNKTCKNCDPMKLRFVVHVYSKYTTTEGVATERGRE